MGMELRMSERSEHYDIHSEFQVPRMANPNPWGSLRGPAPSCTRRRVPPSRRRGATLSRGEPTVVHCRRALFSVGKRGVRYPFVPKSREVPPPMGKQYAILRVQKCKGAAIGAMQYHNDREPGKHTNPDIDQTRTRLNREMRSHVDYEREVQARIDDGYSGNRQFHRAPAQRHPAGREARL